MYVLQMKNSAFIIDGVPPRDSTLITEIEKLIPLHLYVLMSCLAGFGIVMATSFVLFNIIHRNDKYE